MKKLIETTYDFERNRLRKYSNGIEVKSFLQYKKYQHHRVTYKYEKPIESVFCGQTIKVGSTQLHSVNQQVTLKEIDVLLKMSREEIVSKFNLKNK